MNLYESINQFWNNFELIPPTLILLLFFWIGNF